MQELSLHILDLAQNSLHAGASEVCISITEKTIVNTYTLSIRDNGSGMDNDLVEQVTNPFFTTKAKKTGLGIPLLKQHAEMCEGYLTLHSKPGFGTHIAATFQRDHIDRQPLGDIASTMVSLIRSEPDVEFIYLHTIDKKTFTLKTQEIKETLGDVAITNNEILQFITDMINENIKEITST